ncbi:MAG: hypothetical protein HYR94_26100 [Chloroflexi bacterium]|nr:hypothetical protein [Chloroflexota bacterium]
MSFLPRRVAPVALLKPSPLPQPVDTRLKGLESQLADVLGRIHLVVADQQVLVEIRESRWCMKSFPGR